MTSPRSKTSKWSPLFRPTPKPSRARLIHAGPSQIPIATGPAFLLSLEMTRRHPASAFTLIELLTVIAIIGILAGIVIGVGRRASESGREARAKVELAAISTALESYKRQYGDYPRTNSSTGLLKALVGKADANGDPVNTRTLLDLELFEFDGATDPTTDHTLSLIDPWDQRYVYVYKDRTSWSNHSYVLYSMGPDQESVATLTSAGYLNLEASANLDNIYAK